jgi:hypothetical protein
MIGTVKDQPRRGRARGLPRGTRYVAPNYDPSTGEPYRPGCHFSPTAAVKLIDMCAALNISISGFLNNLVEAVDVDPETGAPKGWPNGVQLKAKEAQHIAS